MATNAFKYAKQSRKNTGRTSSNNYVKNVGRSLGYILISPFAQMNQTVIGTATNTKDFAKDLYSSIKDIKSKGKEYDPDSVSGQIKGIATEYKANLLSDLKTGKWYNKERSEKANDQLAASMLGDMGDFDDFGDLDDDWNLDTDDDMSPSEKSPEQISTEQQIAATRESTSTVVKAMDKIAYKAAGTAAEATVRSADYIVSNISNCSNAIYNLNSKGFSTVSTGIAAVNTNMQSLVALAEPLTNHMQNSALFYTKSTEYQDKSLQLLQQIVANTTSKAPNGYRFKGPDFRLDNIFDDGALNLKAWKDQIVTKAKDESSVLLSLLDMVGGIKGAGKMLTASPISGALSIVFSALMPEKVRNTITGFNNSLGDFMKGMITKMKHKSSGNMFIDMIKDAFFPSSGYSDSFDNGNYEKGKVDWDGISRRALTEVIPTQLGKILSALTDEEESRYDYQTGRWKTISAIRHNRKHERVSAATDAGGKYYDTLVESVDDLNISKSKKKQMKAQLENFQVSSFHEDNDDFMNVMKPNYDYKKHGMSKDTWEYMKLFSSILANTKNKNILTDRVSDMLSGRDSYGDANRYRAYNGSLNNQLEDGSFIKGHKKINLSNPADAYGNNTLDYLRAIYIYAGHMDTNLPLLIGPQRRLGKGLKSETGTIKAFNPDDIKKIKRNGIGSKSTISKDGEYKEPEEEEEPTYYNKVENVDLKKGNKNFGKNATKVINDKLNTQDSQLSAKLSKESSKYKSDRDYAEASGKKELDKFLKSHKKQELKYQGELDIISKRSKISGAFSDKFNDWRNNHQKADDMIEKATKLIDIPSTAISDILDEVQRGMVGSIYGIKGKPNKLVETASNGVKAFFGTLTSLLPPAVKDTISQIKDWFMGTEFGQKVVGDAKEGFGEIGSYFFQPIMDTITGGNGKKKKSTKKGVKNAAAVASGFIDDYDYDFNPDEDWAQSSYTDEYASGSKYARKGYAAVSKGELIIPSRLNPFFGSFAKGTKSASANNKKSKVVTSKVIQAELRKSRAQARKSAAKKASAKGKTEDISDEDAEDTVLDETPNQKRNKKIKKAVVGAVINGGTAVIDKVTDSIIKFIGADKGSKAEKDKKDVGSRVKKLYTSVIDDGSNTKKGALVGGLVGAGASILTSTVVGPLAGAAIGAAIGITVKSKKVQAALFGDYDETNQEYNGKNGILPKALSNFLTKNVPTMTKGLVYGGGAGLLLGSPVLGAIAGTAVGYVKSSEKSQEFLFGKKDKNGEYDGGLISKEIINTVNKRKTGMGAGAILGLLAGPFGGPIPNLILGSAVGFAVQSEKFQKWFFGDKDSKDPKKQLGITGFLRENIAKPVVGIVDKTSRLLISSITAKGKSILNFFAKSIADSIGKTLKGSKIGQFFGRVGTGIKNAGMSLLGLPFNLLAGGLQKIDTSLSKKALKNGTNYTITDKNGKRRLMYGQERINARANYGLKGTDVAKQNIMDAMLANAKSPEELEAISTMADRQINANRKYDKNIALGISRTGVLKKQIKNPAQNAQYNKLIMDIKRGLISNTEIPRYIDTIIGDGTISSKDKTRLIKNLEMVSRNAKNKIKFNSGNSNNKDFLIKQIMNDPTLTTDKQRNERIKAINSMNMEDYVNLKKNANTEGKRFEEEESKKSNNLSDEERAKKSQITVIDVIPYYLKAMSDSIDYIAKYQSAIASGKTPEEAAKEVGEVPEHGEVPSNSTENTMGKYSEVGGKSRIGARITNKVNSVKSKITNSIAFEAGADTVDFIRRKFDDYKRKQNPFYDFTDEEVEEMQTSLAAFANSGVSKHLQKQYDINDDVCICKVVIDNHNPFYVKFDKKDPSHPKFIGGLQVKIHNIGTSIKNAGRAVKNFGKAIWNTGKKISTEVHRMSDPWYGFSSENRTKAETGALQVSQGKTAEGFYRVDEDSDYYRVSINGSDTIYVKIKQDGSGTAKYVLPAYAKAMELRASAKSVVHKVAGVGKKIGHGIKTGIEFAKGVGHGISGIITGRTKREYLEGVARNDAAKKSSRLFDDAEYDPDEDWSEQGGAANGRKVTKTGVVAVSEGEMIVPSELNPFYHGVTNKAQQIANERNAVNNFYGSYSAGGIISTIGSIASGIGKGVSAVGSGISKVKGLFGNNSSGGSGTGETTDASDKELSDTIDNIGKGQNNNNPTDTNLNDNTSGSNGKSTGGLGTNAGRAAAKKNSMFMNAISSLTTIPVLLKGIYQNTASTAGYLSGSGSSGKSSGGLLSGLLMMGAGLISKVASFGTKIGSFISKAYKFFSGGSALSSVIKDAAGIAFVGASATGALDNVGEAVGYGKKYNSQMSGTYTDANGKTVTANVARDEKGNYKTNENGQYVDASGNVLETSSLSTKTTDKASYSQTFNQATVRGLAYNPLTHKSAGSLAGAVLKHTKVGKDVSTLYNASNTLTSAVVNSGGDGNVIAAAENAASSATATTFLGKCLNTITKGLKKCPLLKNVDIDGMMMKMQGVVMDIFNSAGAKVLKSILNVVGKVLLIAEIVIDFVTGYQDASTTLKIKKPSTGWKLLAGVLRALKNQIPIIGPMIPDDKIIDVCADFIAPALGLDVSTFKKERDAAQEEVDQYNQENGTNLTWAQYNKQVLGNTNIVEKAGNAIKTAGAKIKSTVTDVVKSGGVVPYLYNKYKDNKAKKKEQKATIEAAYAEIDALAEKNDVDAIAKYDTSKYDGNVLKKIQKYQKKALKTVQENEDNEEEAEDLNEDDSTSNVGKGKAGKSSISKALSKAGGFIKDVAKSGGIVGYMYKKYKEKKKESTNVAAAGKELFNLAKKKDEDAIAGYDLSKFTGDSLTKVKKYQKEALEYAQGTDDNQEAKTDSIQGKAANADTKKNDSINGEIKQAKAAMDRLAENGDVKGLLKYSVDSLSSGISTGHKVILTTIISNYKRIKLISASSNALSKKLGLDEDTEKSNTEFSDATDQLNTASEKGSKDNTVLDKIKGVAYKATTNGPLSGFYKMAFSMSKTVASSTGIFGKIGDVMSNVVDKIKGIFTKKQAEAEDLDNSTSNTSTSSDSSTSQTVHTESNGYAWAGRSGMGSFVSQRDPRYANRKLGYYNVGANGCGPAAAVMAINAAKGADMNEAINTANGYQTPGGTDASYFGDEFARHGVNASYYTDRGSIINSVASGTPTVLMGQDSTNNSKSRSPFGPGAHYVVANGFDRSGNVIVNDPEARGTRKYNSKILNNVSLGVGASGTRHKIYSIYNKFTARGTDTATTVYAYLTSNLGMSSAAACGVMGNMKQESGMEPNTTQKGGDYALGLIQWAGVRKTNLMNFANSRNGSKDTWSDLVTQLEFLKSELSGYSSMVDKMNGNSSPEECAVIFEETFERAGTPMMENRKKYAREYYDQFNGTSTSSVDTSATANTAISSATTSTSSTSSSTNSSSDSTSTDESSDDSSSSSTDFLSSISSLFSNAFSSIFGNKSSSSTDDSSTTTEDSSTSSNAESATESSDSSSDSNDSSDADTYTLKSGSSTAYNPIKSSNSTISSLLPAILNGTANRNGFTASTDDRPVEGVSSKNSAVGNFLNTARSQLGTVETGNNHTKYGGFTGAQNAAWCASFVSWVMNQAYGGDAAKAKAALRTGPTAAVATLRNGFKSANALYSTPQAGDVIIYGSNGDQHTGIVEATDGSNFVSIEGNTGTGNAFSANGGMVNRKMHPNNYSNVYGFGRPNWSAANSAAGSGILNKRYMNSSAMGTTTVENKAIKVNGSTSSTTKTSSLSGMSKETAAFLKVIIELVQSLVDNTTNVNNIYTLLESQCNGNQDAINAVQTAAKSNTNSTSDIDSRLADLRNTVDQILA